jgi:hypothetical protein
MSPVASQSWLHWHKASGGLCSPFPLTIRARPDGSLTGSYPRPGASLSPSCLASGQAGMGKKEGHVAGSQPVMAPLAQGQWWPVLAPLTIPASDWGQSLYIGDNRLTMLGSGDFGRFEDRFRVAET